MLAARTGSTGPSLASTSCSDRDGTNSMTIHGRPLVSNTS
jgi:hypothetical protein